MTARNGAASAPGAQCLTFCRDVAHCPDDRAYRCDPVGGILSAYSVCVPI